MKCKFHFYSILLLLGFLLLPAASHACGTKAEKECCKKETAEQTDKKDCCKDKHAQDQDKGCDGTCGHANCTAPSLNGSILSFYEIEFKNNAFDFSTKKVKFHQAKTFIAAGFTSVWLPPKIK